MRAVIPIFCTRKNQPKKFLSDATFGADPVTGKFVLLGEEASPVRRQLLVTVGKGGENMLFPGPVRLVCQEIQGSRIGFVNAQYTEKSDGR